MVSRLCNFGLLEVSLLWCWICWCEVWGCLLTGVWVVLTDVLWCWLLRFGGFSLVCLCL